MAAPRKASEPECPDLRALFIPLATAKVGANGYKPIDRYRDFRAVFFGDEATKEQRERVLYQVLDLCRMNVPIADAANPNMTYLAAGRQEVGMALLRWLTTEPTDNG